MSTTTNDQVKDAAEALVAVLKAVSGKVESVSNQQQQSMIDITEALKKSVDAFHQTVEASNMVMDRKLETMNQDLEDMKDTNDKMVMTIDTLNGHLTSIEAHFQEQAKRQKLKDLESLWKAGNLKYPQPFYYDSSSGSAESSTLFFNEILPKFLVGHGYDIHSYYFATAYTKECTEDEHGNEICRIEVTDKSNAVFVAKLSEYVEQLTGHKPRLEKRSILKSHTMYYS